MPETKQGSTFNSTAKICMPKSLLLKSREYGGRLGETGNDLLYDINQDFRKALTFNRSLKDKPTQPLYQMPTNSLLLNQA